MLIQNQTHPRSCRRKPASQAAGSAPGARDPGFRRDERRKFAREDAPVPPAQERWRNWFAFAVLRLGLSPQSFWALTVAEWRWLLEAALGNGDAMDAAALKSLLQQYPDKPSCQTQ